jgi:hypothetical protein
MITIAAIPTCHASTAASATGMRAFAAMNAGPSTANAIPIVDGESSPSGMAVTSERPVRFARRNASHVYARSPIITPSAVPGNIFVNTMSAGKPNAPTRMPARIARLTTLSRMSPKNAFTSPGAAHR